MNAPRRDQWVMPGGQASAGGELLLEETMDRARAAQREQQALRRWCCGTAMDRPHALACDEVDTEYDTGEAYRHDEDA